MRNGEKYDIKENIVRAAAYAAPFFHTNHQKEKKRTPARTQCRGREGKSGD